MRFVENFDSYVLYMMLTMLSIPVLIQHVLLLSGHLFSIPE